MKGKTMKGKTFNSLYIWLRLILWHIDQSKSFIQMNSPHMLQHVTFSLEQIWTVNTLKRRHLAAFPFLMKSETGLMLIWWSAVAGERLSWRKFLEFLSRLLRKISTRRHPIVCNEMEKSKKIEWAKLVTWTWIHQSRANIQTRKHDIKSIHLVSTK